MDTFNKVIDALNGVIFIVGFLNAIKVTQRVVIKGDSLPGFVIPDGLPVLFIILVPGFFLYFSIIIVLPEESILFSI